MRASLKVGVAGILLAVGCGGSQAQKKPSGPGEPPPDWVMAAPLSQDKLCGMGVAGAAFNENSPYPRQMSTERAVRNLAGILGTTVEESIIDRETNAGADIELVRNLTVDEALIQRIAELAETEFWLDHDGTGPFAQKNFTYALSCIDADKVASNFKVDARTLKKNKGRAVTPDHVPGWIARAGKRKDGRVCAVGFSLPMFHPDKTFEGVVEDVRGQLAEIIESLVSSYQEELETKNAIAYEAMTVANNSALAKGVIVTDFWYDRDGLGPNKQTRSTYGLGCVYPMDIIAQSLESVSEQAPEEKDKIARVKENAQHAFDALDAEIAKHDTAQESVQ